MFACLCNVIALVIAPWSMLRNIKFISHQDVKGPSSAEKWYRRMLNHLLERLHNALAHCRLSCWFLILVGCWLHLPIVLFSRQVHRKGARDWGWSGGDPDQSLALGQEFVAKLLVASPLSKHSRDVKLKS